MREVEDAFRRDAGAVMATLIRILGDFGQAEDALQDAFAAAIERWPREGVPQNPAAWITTAARRKAIDRLRRSNTRRRSQEALTALLELEQQEAAAQETEPMEPTTISDDRLRLIFTCCHPALSQPAQVALTLRTLCGLTTPQIARAFLVPEATLAQRLVRAKKKIRTAKIPYRVPPPEALGERLGSVLAVIYLVFNEGYWASRGDELIRVDLSAEAIRLGRLLNTLIRGVPEVTGLLALMLLHHARREARIDENGVLVTLEDQDRSVWHEAEMEEGRTLIRKALSAGRPGPYQLQAAIAAIHSDAATAEATDWVQIAGVYDALAQIQPTPVVALNRAAAVAMAFGPDRGLELIEPLSEALDGYCPLHAARADLLRRAGRLQQAAAAYARALELASNDATRRYLEQRLSEVAS